VERIVSVLGKSLIAGAAFAFFAPAAIGAILLQPPAEAAADQPQVVATAAPVKPMPLGTLGRANAVAWLSVGHVSAVP
jgi:hypothetical protein